MMSMGVRISWLIFARKSLLERASASAFSAAFSLFFAVVISEYCRFLLNPMTI
jgi:hypothetical protein